MTDRDGAQDDWVGWGDPDPDSPDPDSPESDSPDSPDPGREAERRRTKRIALGGLAVVAVIVVATLLLVQLVHTSSGAPSGPADAARQWGLAVVHHDHDRERRLECGRTVQGRLLARRVHGSGTVTVETALLVQRDHWVVPLHAPGLAGRTFLAPVQRRGATYVVC